MSKLTKFVSNPELFLSDMVKKRHEQIRMATHRYLPIGTYDEKPNHELSQQMPYKTNDKQPSMSGLKLEQIQMLSIQKIYLTSDILMTKEKEQFSNLRWFFELLCPVIHQATSIKPIRMSSSLSQANRFSRIEFFKKSGIQLDINQTQFYFNDEDISQASLSYLNNFISSDTLVIGYEMSEQTRRLLTKLSVVYVDIWLHPIRFLDDVLFGFSSNHEGLFNRLKDFELDEHLYALYATRLKVQSYKGYRRMEYKIEPDAAVFIGQTLEDKAICKNGKMLTILDFKSQLEAAGKKYKKVYYSRHPYVKSGDEKILEYLKTKKFVEIVDWPVYALLAHDHIKYVFSVSSSVVFEARAFGKKADFLYRPVIELSSEFHQRSYITVYQEFVSPHFWSHILEALMPVNQAPRLMYLEGKDKLRDMLAFYWSYRHIDKLEGMRHQLNAVDAALQKIRKNVGLVSPSITEVQPELSVRNVLDMLRDYLPTPLKTMTNRYLGTPVFAEHVIKQNSIQRSAVASQQAQNLAQPVEKNAVLEFQKISEQMQSVDVVSFDVFDTLLVRPFAKPDDLFIFMQPMVDRITDRLPDFRTIRLSARKLVPIEQCIGEEVPLKARYQAIGVSHALSEQQVDDLYQLELDLELKFIRPRLHAKKIFEEARRLGKKTIIVSDTFFPKSYVESLLAKNNYTDYDELYVSSETGLLKATGNVYPFLLNILQAAPEKILHIGDNHAVDIVHAKNHGFLTLHLPATVAIFEKNTVLSTVIKHSNPLARSLHVGLLANRLADDPFSISTPSYVNGSLENFGYMIYGPILFAFASWLLKLAKKDQMDQLFFLARDGDIIKRAYDLIAKQHVGSPSSTYIYASRRGVNVPSLRSQADILELLSVNFSPMSLGALLEQRFGIRSESLPLGIFKEHGWLDDQQIVKYNQDQVRLSAFLLEISDFILENSRKEREALLNYFSEKSLVHNASRKAIVDIGHNGTMQRSISRLIGENNLSGYYFVTHEKISSLVNEGLDARGFAGERLDPKNKNHPCMNHVLMYELLFLNEHGSFVKIKNKQGCYDPILLSTEGEESRIEMTKKVHQGALEFILDVLDIDRDVDLSIDGVLQPYAMFLSQPKIVDVKMFESVVFENFYSGRSYQHIVSMQDPKKSVWQEGSSLLQNYQVTNT